MVRRPTPALVALVALVALALVPAARSTPPPRPAIIGGTPASAPAWPSIAALVQRGAPSAAAGQFCGGTLIDARWVLTAAHCVAPLPSAAALDVVVGRSDLAAASPQERLPASAIVVHPAYDAASHDNDVALVGLPSSLAQPRMDLVAPGDEALWRAGTSARIAGWGLLSQSASAPTPILNDATVPIVDDAVCADPSINGPAVHSASMLCAGDVANGGVDTCQGDSGGPLAVADGHGAAVLVGATSWGLGCGQPRRPGVYTRLASYRGWIYSQIGIQPPAAASGVSATPGRESAAVSWLAPADGGRPLTSYRVTASPGGATALTTATTVALSGLQAGTSYTFTVTAASAAGYSPPSAPSPAVDVPTTPAATSAPAVTGTPREGRTLVASPGGWSGNPTLFHYQWQRCDRVAASCDDISGATASAYAPAQADLDRRLRVAVTASNLAGSAAASSTPTEPVARDRATLLLARLRLTRAATVRIRVVTRGGRALRLSARGSLVGGRVPRALSPTVLRARVRHPGRWNLRLEVVSADAQMAAHARLELRPTDAQGRRLSRGSARARILARGPD